MLDLKHELKLDKTRDEKARMNFVSGLRAHVLNDMAGGMRAVWDAEVEPAFRRSRGRRPKDGPEVHAALRTPAISLANIGLFYDLPRLHLGACRLEPAL